MSGQFTNESGQYLLVGASNIALSAVVADSNATVAAAIGLRLIGYSIKETAGVPAATTGRIMHGATVAGGTSVINFNLALSTSDTKWFGPDGIACPNGISVDWLTGQFDITLFYKIVS
jgi:hypothetical protein